MLTSSALADVQANLRRAFQTILTQGYAATQGNRFDDAVAECLTLGLQHPSGYGCIDGTRLRFKTVSSSEFAKGYPKYKALCARQDFNFQGLLASSATNGDASRLQPDMLIVRQPNGSQNWPDILVIANGVGLPIEVKSSKECSIVWNGGIPRPGRLYVFNSRAGQKPGVSTGTTLFMGEDITDDKEVAELLAHHESQHRATQAFNARMRVLREEQYAKQQASNPGIPIPVRPWTDYYDRAMYCNNANYFADPVLRQQRETAALDFVEGYHAKPPPVAPVIQPRRRLR